MTSLYISGDGRMGKSIRRLMGDFTEAISVKAADVVIDYSHPEWTSPLVEELLQGPRPLVVGTTGLDEELLHKLELLAREVPVVLAPNTGTGVQVLAGLVKKAAEALGESWDIEILEMHHRNKVDAPSGTAWMLMDATGAERTDATVSRSGQTGERTDDEVGLQALRGGDVVGEHTVYFVGQGERIELTHRAWNRQTFARGGLRAAQWAAVPDRPPGLFSMADVLGF